MAKKRTLYSSIKELTAVPLRDLKPIQIEKKSTRVPMSTGKRLLLITLLCLLVFIITFVFGKEWSPLNTVVHSVSAPIQKCFSRMADFFSEKQDARSLKKENDELRTRVAQLEYENTQYMTQLKELDELKSLYDLDNYYADYPKTGAQIVSGTGSNWVENTTIDHGANDGLRRYMPVISGGGLFGRIETVFDDYSTVLTILSPDCEVSCTISRSGDHVIVQGSPSWKNEGLCIAVFDVGTVDVQVGDILVTSNYSSVYPPGIRVGTVQSFQKNEDGLTAQIEVLPFSNVDTASTVLIITEAASYLTVNEDEDTKP